MTVQGKRSTRLWTEVTMMLLKIEKRMPLDGSLEVDTNSTNSSADKAAYSITFTTVQLPCTTGASLVLLHQTSQFRT